MKKQGPMDTPPGCASCAFWLEQISAADEIRWGQCRRYPPTMIPTTNEDTGEAGSDAAHPPTYPDSWCGEWRPKQ